VNRFRLRLSSILWLVALVAVFLAGVRYGEYRAVARRGKQRFVRNMLLDTLALDNLLNGQVNRGKRNPAIILHSGP
jgi:hypothetical protein